MKARIATPVPALIASTILIALDIPHGWICETHQPDHAPVRQRGYSARIAFPTSLTPSSPTPPLAPRCGTTAIRSYLPRARRRFSIAIQSRGRVSIERCKSERFRMTMLGAVAGCERPRRAYRRTYITGLNNCDRACHEAVVGQDRVRSYRPQWPREWSASRHQVATGSDHHVPLLHPVVPWSPNPTGPSPDHGE
jgi:hypothetical protein